MDWLRAICFRLLLRPVAVGLTLLSYFCLHRASLSSYCPKIVFAQFLDSVSFVACSEFFVLPKRIKMFAQYHFTVHGHQPSNVSIGGKGKVHPCTGPPSFLYNGYRIFPGGKERPGRDADPSTPHSFLVPWSWKGRALPLLPLWAIRPVQSLSACTRVHFTFFILSFP